MRRHLHFILVIVISTACIASISHHAGAAPINWTNNSGGAFGTAANWTPASVPAINDEARFELNNTYTVTLSASHTINTLIQSRGDVTLDLNGNTFRQNSTTGNTLGTSVQSTTLRITDGTFRPGSLSVGGVAGSTSALVLDTGSTSILGNGLFHLGSSGTGNLTIQNAATLTTSTGAAIGLNPTGVGTATVTGLNSRWTINNSPLRIGSAGAGTLNVLSNGRVTTGGLEIGEFLNSIGTLNVSGLNAEFIADGTANIGGAFAPWPAASATINIGSGGIVGLNGTTNFRSSATVNINGGTLNVNTVNVTSGATFNWTAGTVNFATGAGITTALLDTLLAGTNTLGANRTLSATAGTLTLGSTLVLAGGRISAPTININANMDIGGFSNLAATNTINIQAGRTIQLRDFSTLTSTNPFTNNGGTLVLGGQFANVTGVLTNTAGFVRGTGRFSGGLNNGATGTIRLASGDHLIVDGAANTNVGTIELAGGTIEYSQALANNLGGVITGRGVFRGSSATPGATGLNNTGVLSFSAGITDIFGDVNNAGTGIIIAAGGSVVTFYDDVVHNGVEIRTNSGSRSVFFGDVTGAGPFTGTGDVEFNGDLKPGNSPANVSFGGNVVVAPTAGINIELAGTTKGTAYDALTVAGTLSLGGAINVALLDGFMPQVGDTFELFTAAQGIEGTFNNELLPKLGGGLFLDLLYQPNSVLLSVAGTPGDYNYDGHVDAADYVIWRKTLPQSGAGLPADGNQSGGVDPGDQNVWQDHYGTPNNGGSAGNANVPEPSAAALAILASALIYRRLRKGHATRIG
jgi:fibronectin-binding autotransporter adhesin